MRNKGFLKQVSDLIIKTDEDSKDWIKSRRLRSTWYIFILWALLGVTISFIIGISPLAETLSKTNSGVQIVRGLMFAHALVLLIIWFSLTFYYFKFTIEQGHPIKFDSISTFYLGMVGFFGVLYVYTFYMNPNLFQYNSSHIYWSSTLASRTYESWSTKIHFILYSAFESIGSKSTYVESNSVLVSLLNYIQTLYCFSLVSLLIAGYVNQKTNKPA